MGQKAFIVQEVDEGTGGVVYAKTNAQARRIGANEYASGEFHEVTCRRAPDLDGLERDPREQTRRLLARGWWFDSPTGYLTDDDDPWVSKQGAAYRSPFQWLAEREAAAERTRLQKEWLRKLWGNWWFAEDIDVRISPDGCADASIRVPYLQGRVRFREGGGNRCTIELRDLPVWQRAYVVNRDAELAEVAS